MNTNGEATAASPTNPSKSRHTANRVHVRVVVYCLILLAAGIASLFWYGSWYFSKGYGRWRTRAEMTAGVSAFPIPDDFPRVIPRYPGARLIRDRVKREPVHGRVELTFVTEDTVESVYHFYERFFRSNGFGTGGFLGGTRIYRPGEHAVVVSRGGKGISRNIYVSIDRSNGVKITTITIETLDVVECGPGARCYDYPGVTRSRSSRQRSSRPENVEDLVRRAAQANCPMRSWDACGDIRNAGASE
jgi:hypothetical protein